MSEVGQLRRPSTKGAEPPFAARVKSIGPDGRS